MVEHEHSTTHHAKVAEDDSLAEQGRCVRGLDGLLGLCLLALHLNDDDDDGDGGGNDDGGGGNDDGDGSDDGGDGEDDDDGLLALHLLVLDGVEVDLADAVDRLLLLEGDEAEASVTFCLLVHQHHRLLNFT